MAGKRKNIRLFKVAKELNVSTSMLVEHLNSNGQSVEDSPNTKLSGEQYDLLLREFASEKMIKIQAEKLSELRIQEVRTESFNHVIPRSQKNRSEINFVPVGVKTIDLSGKEIEEIQKALIKSKDLEKLILRECGPSIQNLPISKYGTSLKMLDLSKNSLKKIPSYVFDLKLLETLKLNSNQIQGIPHKIEVLSNLRELDLFGNSIGKIPSNLFRLSQLTSLNISNNRISSISQDISYMRSLKTFRAFGNLIDEIPSRISGLKNIELLDLHNNSISSIPREIGNMSNLKYLNLENNRIEFIPIELAKLEKLESNQVVEKINMGLNLLGNVINVPPEVLRQEPFEILQFVKDSNSETTMLREAKFIFLGSGEVGKTSIINILTKKKFNPSEEQTDGIAINKWHFINAGKKTTFRIWDFGGQEIMHSTHKFFLSQNSIYSIVLNARVEDEINRNLNYWLKMVGVYAPGAPIIVIVNKCDQHTPDIPINTLRKSHPMIIGLVETSCSQVAGFEDLRKLIGNALTALPHFEKPIPKKYYRIIDKLDKASQNFFFADKYKNYIKELYEDLEDGSLSSLTELLHNLGIIFNYKKLGRKSSLHDVHVINPSWITNGVYKIITSKEIRMTKGVLTEVQISELLSQVGYTLLREQEFILDIMERFELCYRMRQIDKILFPVAFSIDPPEHLIYPTKEENKLRFAMYFDYLPSNIIGLFAVQNHSLILGDFYWRKGLIIKKGINKAAIKIESEIKLEITVWGNGDLREFLTYIRHEVSDITDQIPETNLNEVLIVEHDNQLLEVNYLDLRTFERSNILVLPVARDGRIINLDVQKVLEGFITEAENEAYEELNKMNDNIPKETVLFVSANPTNTVRIQIDKVKKVIQSTFDHLGNRKFELRDSPAATVSDLHNELLKYKSKVVHLAMHGNIAGGIAFEKDNNDPSFRNVDSFAEIFEGIGTQLVILQSCYSAEEAEYLLRYVDFVIGMSDVIKDEHATAFAEGFYQGYLNGLSFKESFYAGKKRIRIHNISGESLPVFFPS